MRVSMNSQWQEKSMNVQNCALTSIWRRDNNSDCRGHDLHDPEKDCSIALGSYRTTQARLMEVATVTHDIGCQRDSCINRRKTSEDRVVGSIPRQRTHILSSVCLYRSGPTPRAEAHTTLLTSVLQEMHQQRRCNGIGHMWSRKLLERNLQRIFDNAKRRLYLEKLLPKTMMECSSRAHVASSSRTKTPGLTLATGPAQ